MNKLRLIATFMIFLVLSLPVYASISLRTYNSDGVEGFRRETGDTITVEATIDQQSIAPSQVRLANYQFDNCTTVGSNSVCTFTSPNNVYGGEYSFEVTHAGESADGSFISDDTPPDVQAVNVHQQTDGVYVKYKIFEHAYSSVCGRLDRIEYTVDGQTIDTKTQGLELKHNCKFPLNDSNPKGEDEHRLTIPSTGLKEICVVAYDVVGNSGELCKDFYVDHSAPVASNLEIHDSNGLLKYIAPKRGTIMVDVKFTVKEEYLKVITGDLSDLTEVSALKSGLRNLEPTCYPQNCSGTCACEFKNVPMQRPSAGTVNINLHMEDDSENKVDQVPSYTFILDDVAPQVKSVETIVFQGTNYVNQPYNVVRVTLEEAGSGFNQQKVFLDLSPFMTGDRERVYPTECNQQGAEWVCEWRGVTAYELTENLQKTPLTLAYPSQDDAGNMVEGGDSSVTLDKEYPVVDSYNVRAVGALGEFPSQYPKSGDTIVVIVKAEDTLPVTAYADFSQVAQVRGYHKTDCTYENQVSTCTWERVGPLYSGPLFNQPVNLVLVDLVGNNNSEQIYINISGVEGQVSDYWSINSGDPSPARIDKQVLNFVPFKVYFPTNLSGPPSVEPISVKLVDCDGETGFLDLNRDDLALPDLLGAPGKQFYTKFNLREGTAPTTSTLTFNCTFRIISRTDFGYISQPEIDSEEFTINFYNSELGTIDDEIQEKIDEEKDSWLVKGGWITSINKVIEYIKKSCQVIQMFDNVRSIIRGIDSILDPLRATPAERVAKVFSFLDSKTGKVFEKIYNKLGETCYFISCSTKSKYYPGAKIKEWFAKWQGLPLAKAFGLKKASVDDFVKPEDSIIISLATICLPGVFYNLNKYRQVECAHIYCMESQIPAGLPAYYCDRLKATQMCKYFYGEIFQLIPIAQFVDYVFNFIKDAIRDPIILLGIGWAYLCDHLREGSGIATALCLKPKDLAKAAQAIDALFVSKTWKSIKFGSVDYCKLIEESEEGEE
ncbi:hypothetical protein ACFLZ7_01180 [Nanoarchaeota archaeon]